MLRNVILRLALAACGVVLAGCATKEPELKAKKTTAIALTDEKRTDTATVELYDLVTVTLPRPKLDAYQWIITFHDTRYLKQTTEITPSSDADAGPTISFIARHVGRTRLRFLLTPPSPGPGRGADPVDQQELVLTIE